LTKNGGVSFGKDKNRQMVEIAWSHGKRYNALWNMEVWAYTTLSPLVGHCGLDGFGLKKLIILVLGLVFISRYPKRLKPYLTCQWSRLLETGKQSYSGKTDGWKEKLWLKLLLICFRLFLRKLSNLEQWHRPSPTGTGFQILEEAAQWRS